MKPFIVFKDFAFLQWYGFFSFERVFNCIAHPLLIFNNNFISCIEWEGQELQYLVLVINFFLSWLNEYYNYKERQKYKLAWYLVGTCWFIGFSLGKAQKSHRRKKQVSGSCFRRLGTHVLQPTNHFSFK